MKKTAISVTKLGILGIFIGLLLAACGDTATGTATGASRSGPAPSTATSRTPTTAVPADNPAKALTDLGQNLTAAREALKKNDLAGAKSAYQKFDEGWIEVETHVQRVSRELYKEIEDSMTAVGRELLRNNNPNAEKVLPLLQTLQEKYNNAVKLVVSAPATNGGSVSVTPIAGVEVETATARVSDYLKGYADKLVKDSEDFVAAVKSRDLEKSKAAYLTARFDYEAIEFLAEAFSDSDTAIDARPDDFPQGENDPNWTGFHPLEKAIFADNKLDARADKLADQLLNDVKALRDQVKKLDIEPGMAINGAAELIEEIQNGKITGEEERYSHTDFNDFKANFTSARFVYESYSPFIKQRDATLDTRLRGSFSEVETSIAPYFTPDGRALDYSKLDDKSRKAIAQKIEALADAFSKVNGTLGLK